MTDRELLNYVCCGDKDDDGTFIDDFEGKDYPVGNDDPDYY